MKSVIEGIFSVHNKMPSRVSFPLFFRVRALAVCLVVPWSMVLQREQQDVVVNAYGQT